MNLNMKVKRIDTLEQFLYFLLLKRRNFMIKVKVIIVDDEITGRNTIKRLLENNLEYEIVADFSEGKAAIEWLRKNEIDIMICDMQIQEMSGVELIRMAHVINQFLPVVVISAFDNFEFVRGSLINGADNYLLKHELTKDNLLRVLNQVREKYRIVPEERKLYHRIGYCMKDKNEFCEENIKKMSEQKQIDFICHNIIPLVISPDYLFIENINPLEYKQELGKAVIDILGQILGSEYKYLVYFTKQAHIMILLSFADVTSTLFILNTVKNLTGRLQRQIIRMLDITTTIVVGELKLNLNTAIQEVYYLDSLARDKLYFGGNRVISSMFTEKIDYYNNDIPIGFWKQLKFEMSNQEQDCKEVLNEIFSYMEDVRMDIKYIQLFCDKLIELMIKQDMLTVLEAEQVNRRIKENEIFEYIRIEIMELYNNKKEYKKNNIQKYSLIVRKAINYVIKNYDKDISLEKCAEEVGSSYTHLSRIFKQETGMRFVEFLNMQRVNKAKSLLLRNKISMKEIVEKAGFRNYNYFFKVFKENEGITPTEFIAKN
jgi:hypothetical protein